MNKSAENSNEKSHRLNLGKNTCSKCGRDFIIDEIPLSMPGTKDLESVNCPYCGTYNGEIFINGLALSRKIDQA